MKTRPRLNRAGVLHDVIMEILSRKDGRIPVDIAGIDECFSGVEDLVGALMLRWHTRLIASLERGLLTEPEDRKEAVIEAWRHATWIYWGVRMVLDQLAEDPPNDVVARALQVTARNDWAAMAMAAGLASGFDEQATRVGHRLELEARRRNEAEHSTGREPRPRTLIGKLRKALAGSSAGVARR